MTEVAVRFRRACYSKRTGTVLVTGAVCFSIATVAPAQQVSDELARLLAERDAVIAELQARVDRLERQLGTAEPAPPPALSAAPASAPVPASTEAEIVAADPPPRPGQLEVDPEAAERALERTLVLTGDLLLPVGKIDLEPSITYLHSDQDDLAAIVPTADGSDLVARTVRMPRNEVTAAVDARIGLPFDSQLELRLPFEYVGEPADITTSSEDERAFGIGDFGMGFAKTLVRESGPIPDLIGRVTWDSNFGRDTEGDLTINDDFHDLRGSISALKRLDPLAVTARTSYRISFENDDFDPGNTFGVGAAAALAVSPATSLRLGFDASFSGEDEFNGSTLQGSDENSALLSFGVSSVVGRRTLLNVNVGAGLTDDSPDYFIGASLPVRLDAPW